MKNIIGRSHFSSLIWFYSKVFLLYAIDQKSDSEDIDKLRVGRIAKVHINLVTYVEWCRPNGTISQICI